MNEDPLVPFCGLYENTSQRTGKRYFVGYVGKAKLLMLENRDAKEGEPGWTLFVTTRPERPPEQREPGQPGGRLMGNSAPAATTTPAKPRCAPAGVKTATLPI